MNKNRVILTIAWFFLNATFSLAADVKIQPLSEVEGKSIINELNDQGIVFSFDKNATNFSRPASSPGRLQGVVVLYIYTRWQRN